MKGKNTYQNLADSFERNQKIIEYLMKHRIYLETHFNEEEGDFISKNSGKIYEFKYDPHMGFSGNVMIELFASVDRGNFEKGWAYRYQTTDYLLFFGERYIYCYKCRELLDYFWEQLHEKKLCNMDIRQGVKENPNVVLVMLKEAECERFLEFKIDMRENTKYGGNGE